MEIANTDADGITGSLCSAQEIKLRSADWADLAADAVEPNPFFSSALLAPALDAFGDPGVSTAVICDAAGRLLALAPIEPARGYARLPVRYAATWLHPHCFFGAPLIRRGSEREALAALFDLADRQGAFLRLRHLDAGGSVYKAALEAAAATGRLAAPSAAYERALLQAPFTTEAYLERSLRRKKRKELRRLKARLSDEGEFRFEALADGAALDGWTEDFLGLEAGGWKGRARTALASASAGRAFFEQAAAGARDAGILQFFRLTLSGKPIAMIVNFVERGEAYSFKIAYDEAYARYSPGVMIEIEMMRALEKEPGFAFIDSCAAPDHPMINSLWRERRKIAALNVSRRDAPSKALFRLLMGLERAGERLRAMKPDVAADADL